MTGTRTGATPEERGRPGFAPGLEGLRGLAVCVILLYHNDFVWIGGGFLGVSTFFTLSGFLITALLIAEHEHRGRIDLGAFYARRVRRILPAALLALAGIVVFGALVAEPAQIMRLRGDGISALFYVANWWLMATGADYATQFGAPTPVQHFWSLAIEEQFYLVHPWLVLAGLGMAARSRRPLAALLALLTLTAWIWTAWLEASLVSNARLYYGTDTRVAELLVGALVAVLADPRATPPTQAAQRMIGVLGVVGLVLSAAFWCVAAPQDPRLYRGGLALYAIASAAVVAAAALPGSAVSTTLARTPLRWLGRISYGAYLYHWPIYLWLDEARTGLEPWTLLPLRLLVTLLIADLSYRLLEEPIRHGRRLHGPSRVLLPAAASAAIVAGFVTVTANPLPPEFTTSRSPIPSSPAVRYHPIPSAGAVRILIVGDSLAESLGRGLARWGAATGAAVVESAASRGCGIARGPFTGRRTPAQIRDRIRCDNWSLRWDRALGHEPELVVVLTAGWDQTPRKLPEWTRARDLKDPIFDEWLRTEFAEASARLASGGAHVAWLTAPCVLALKGPKYLADPATTLHFNQSILAPFAAANQDHVTLVDLQALVCPDGKFTDTLGAVENARPDGVHFSDAGANWIAARVGPQLVAIAERRVR